MAELFDRFEVNRMPRWPLMSRLLALSVVLHGIFLVTIVYIPTLRNMLYVAGSMAGLKFVNEDYDRTLIGQRATVVQLPPHEKLFYPPDYFGASEVAETTLMPDATFVQQVEPPPPPPIYRPRRVRTPRSEATAQPSPSPVSNEVAQAAASPSPTPSPTPVTEEERKKAEEEMKEFEKKTGVKQPTINSKPFVDVALEGKELFDQQKLNLNSSIDVTATAQRMDDGKLDPETVRINWKSASDETTALLAQKLITALSESKVLGPLDGAKDVNLALKLDEQDISVTITNGFPSAELAEKYANGYGLALWAARVKKSGTDEGDLFNKINLDQRGNQFIISFKMSKEAAGKMITNLLAKKAAEAAAQNKSKG